MRHKSVRLESSPVEFINITPYNPLISKCEIKVCYVGDKPNRNRSIITKDVAKKMANSLPGCPIVGYYNEHEEDFEEHNRQIEIANGKFTVRDTTKPYGFVDLNAKVWFQKFIDDDQFEREYLMTEGWLWTKQYKESQRCVEEGNNHSMELDEETLDAFWTEDKKGNPEFFIINEAIISKLCILGDEAEPCFEGSTITKPTIEFSFDDGFKQELRSMMDELRELLNKGGEKVFSRYNVEIGDALWTALYNHIEANLAEMTIEGVFEDEQVFAVLKNGEEYVKLNCSLNTETNEYSFAEETEVIEYTPEEEPQFSAEAIAEYKAKKDEEKKGNDDKSKKDDSDNNSEDKCPKCGKPKDECTCKHEDDDDDKKKKKYVLEEVEEYTELLNRYNSLEESYNTLKAKKETLDNEISSLREYKSSMEKKDKEAMIENFYMLSDEDKKDVIDNIDTYSLDEIEAKLSIICVRNKVSFDLDENKNNNGPTTYNLSDDNSDDLGMPAWIKAVIETSEKKI